MKYFNFFSFSPQTSQTVNVSVSSIASSNGENIFFKNRSISPTSSSSHFPIRSPLNLVEDEQSSTTSIIMFKEDSKR